jgi:hypothetical protein
MTFTKPKDITFQQISDQSGVGLRTVKRYASGQNITVHNAEAIKRTIAEFQATPISVASIGIMPASQKEFFFPRALFKQNLFWSSPIDKIRNIDGVIEVYVKTPNLYDIYTLVRLFGAGRVMNIAHSVYVSILKQYGLSLKKLLTLPEYQAVEQMIRYSSSIAGGKQ